MSNPIHDNFQKNMSLKSKAFAVYWQECSLISSNVNIKGLKNILLLKLWKLHHQQI